MIYIYFVVIFLAEVLFCPLSISTDDYAKRKKHKLIKLSGLKILFFRSKLREEKDCIGKFSFALQIFNAVYIIIYLILIVLYFLSMINILLRNIALLSAMIYFLLLLIGTFVMVPLSPTH